VPSNFQTVRGMAGYVEHKRGGIGERGGRLRSASRSR
jgi:hypothetical protein